ncbi:hypothetical protein B0T19DRAFT_488889 [Cercophora scortea]|uniref:MYND-type domain-containing protein n=1 Tax=Cercophora scortea TaxID=314031 RepID=A0AAE0I3W8_9PEZI|nr:hypothetical protein B0T19DRAFT_488889 [Cercophora scortea]
MATKFNDLSDAVAFPAWDLLPWDGALDDRYEAPGENGLPKRHWCFLGEIQSFFPHHTTRFHTVVKDGSGNGKDHAVGFFLDHYDDLDASKLHDGHTMAIMYAHRRYFPDMDHTPGIGVEDVEYVHIFPLGLRKLKDLGHEMQKYCPGENGQKCHGCDKVAEPGQTVGLCGGCKTFRYCNKDCQAKAWNRDRLSHKETCRVLRDPAFHELLKLDFSTYTGSHTFTK